jgi:phage baseplate assembly protein W
MPFKNLELNPVQYNLVQPSFRTQFYKGFTTVNPNNTSSKLYDFELIKQNIINHFNTKKGERLMNPTFGTIIWDLIMEPLTDNIRQLLTDDMNKICNFDPRVYPIQVSVNEYETGYVIEITLALKNTDQRSVLKLAFDQKLGLVEQ